jgi:hypothetical protein
MSVTRLPPRPPGCLERRSPSTQKGGTLIAAGVTDWETHERRRCSPDGYRPDACPGCHGCQLHVHDYVERKLRSDAEWPTAIVVVRFLCVLCHATWRVLPAFLPCYLQRRWAVVETVTLGPPPSPSVPAVPARTRSRWQARLASAIGEALRDVQDGTGPLALAVGALASDGTRCELALVLAAMVGAAPGRRLAVAAAVIHAGMPGVRLM